MLRWKVNTPTLLVLSCMVFVMLLIVVLPDVDLPDTAFRQGTAPLVVHAQANAAPPVVTVATLFQFPEPDRALSPDLQDNVIAGVVDPNFRPILLRSIRR